MNEEELKDMDKELDKILEPKTLQQKILYIQLEMKGVKKDKDGYNYKYYDINGLLAQLKPLLQKHGLLVMQELHHIEGKPALKTSVRSSGECIESVTPLPTNTITKNGMTETDPQRMGSCITYYRRYALASLFLLEAEDNDAAK